MIRFLMSLVLATATPLASAQLHIEINEGNAAAIPIGVERFEGETSFKGFAFSQIIADDLSHSGRFSSEHLKTHEVEVKLADLSLENVVRGQVEKVRADHYDVSFDLIDVIAAKANAARVENGELKNTPARPMLSKVYRNIPASDLRSLAHHVSDLVFESLTGTKGVFSTQLAYVNVMPSRQGIRYQLEVSDSDGFRPQLLMESSEPLMSPTWHPSGRKLAYVSFEGKRAAIYVIELATGKRTKLSQFPGINGAPAWSPDGQKMVVVLSKDGSPKLYLFDLKTKAMEALTKGYSIDTEPEWAPDGQSIYFTSNRGGKPQIYQVALKDKSVKRVTFEGNYNARPRISHDGRTLVTVHRGKDKVFRIAKLDLATQQVTYLSHQHQDESPSIAPNGAMVIYGTEDSNRRILGMVTINGRGQLKLPAREGNVQEPAWSPFLT